MTVVKPVWSANLRLSRAFEEDLMKLIVMLSKRLAFRHETICNTAILPQKRRKENLWHRLKF